MGFLAHDIVNGAIVVVASESVLLAGLIGHFHYSPQLVVRSRAAALECGCEFFYTFSVYRIDDRSHRHKHSAHTHTHTRAAWADGENTAVLVLTVERWRIHSKKWIELLYVIALTHRRDDEAEEEEERLKANRVMVSSVNGSFE